MDIIGDRPTEINVTSPTCVREIEAQFDINICGLLMDAIERRIKAKPVKEPFFRNDAVITELFSGCDANAQRLCFERSLIYYVNITKRRDGNCAECGTGFDILPVTDADETGNAAFMFPVNRLCRVDR